MPEAERRRAPSHAPNMGTGNHTPGAAAPACGCHLFGSTWFDVLCMLRCAVQVDLAGDKQLVDRKELAEGLEKLGAPTGWVASCVAKPPFPTQSWGGALLRSSTVWVWLHFAEQSPAKGGRGGRVVGGADRLQVLQPETLNGLSGAPCGCCPPALSPSWPLPLVCLL